MPIFPTIVEPNNFVPILEIDYALVSIICLSVYVSPPLI